MMAPPRSGGGGGPSLAFLESAGVAWVDSPRSSWVIPARARSRAASAATRSVVVDGAAAPLRRNGGNVPSALPRDGAFADLPDELLVLVLRNQAPRILGRLARTCQRLRRVASSGALWSELFRRRFPRAYRSRAASSTPAQIERMPWKRTYCEQIYEQWARRRHAQEQQRIRDSERHKAEARQWCKVGGRGTQRLFNTVYHDTSGIGSVGSISSVAGSDASPVRRRGTASPSLNSPVLERSLGATGSSFFMEQMAANTRQFLKPSNKKKFLKARAGEQRIEQARGRGSRRASGLVTRAAADSSRGQDLIRRTGLPQGLLQREHRLRRDRPLSAAGPPGRPKGLSLAPPPTA